MGLYSQFESGAIKISLISILIENIFQNIYNNGALMCYRRGIKHPSNASFFMAKKTLTIFGWSVVNTLNKPRNSFDCA